MSVSNNLFLHGFLMNGLQPSNNKTGGTYLNPLQLKCLVFLHLPDVPRNSDKVSSAKGADSDQTIPSGNRLIWIYTIQILINLKAYKTILLSTEIQG